VLVLDRDRRDPAADERGHLRRPHAGGVDDVLGRDPLLAGVDGHDLVASAELDRAHPRAEGDAHAERAGGVGERVSRDVGVDVPVAAIQTPP
jgi:hypothetical protein